MNDHPSEPVDPTTPSPVAAAAPGLPAPAPAPQKRAGSVSIILFGVLGAAVAVVAALMSRSIATPQASSSPRPAAVRPAPPARAVTETVPPSRWTSGGRWISDRKSVAFELKSNNRVNVWMGQVQPVLVIRCVGNRTETFVYTETAARIEPGMDDRAVRVRLDDEPYVDERWPDSDEHKGLFAPNGATFAQRLLDAKTMRFEFTPHNAETAEVQFNVAGLREVMQPVEKKCGWGK